MNWKTLQEKWSGGGLLGVSLEGKQPTLQLIGKDGPVSDPVELGLEAEEALQDPSRAAQRIQETLSEQGWRERRVVAILPVRWALTTLSELPAAAEDDLEAYLELQAESAFSMSAGELKVAHSIARLPGDDAFLCLAALPQRKLEAVLRILEMAGCKTVSVCFGLRSREIVDGDGMGLVVSHQGTEWSLSVGGGVAALHALPGVRTGEDVQRLIRELRITLGRLPERLREQGEECRIVYESDIPEMLRSALQQGMEGLGLHSRVETLDSEGARRVSTAGASEFLSGRPVTFELYQPPMTRWEKVVRRFDRRRHGVAVAAALLVLFLPMAAFAVRSGLENRLQRQWTQLGPQVAELEQLQERIRTFRPWFDNYPDQVERLASFMEAFPAEGEVWATNIELRDGERLSCAGLARNQSALMAFLDRVRSAPGTADVQIQQVRGEDPIQFTLTLRFEVAP